MAVTQKVKVVEFCRVGPASNSVGEASLPLTFFDVIFLQTPPVQRIFFYELSDDNMDTTHFLNSLLPILKTSLSLALRLFYPLAGTLTLSPDSGEHVIHYAEGDLVQLTIAESDLDFHALVADHPKDDTPFHGLVPELPSSDLLSVQVTVFTAIGFCVGVSFLTVAADGSSSMQFMKYWSSISRLGHYHALTESLPLYDRGIVGDPEGLKTIFLDQKERYRWDPVLKSLDVRGSRATFCSSCLPEPG